MFFQHLPPPPGACLTKHGSLDNSTSRVFAPLIRESSVTCPMSGGLAWGMKPGSIDIINCSLYRTGDGHFQSEKVYTGTEISQVLTSRASLPDTDHLYTSNLAARTIRALEHIRYILGSFSVIRALRRGLVVAVDAVCKEHVFLCGQRPEMTHYHRRHCSRVLRDEGKTCLAFCFPIPC